MWKILIADDENIERMIEKKILEDYYGEQCQILEAINGRLAVETAENQEIHTAVLDISMPGINGIEAAKRIRKLWPACGIIFLTAYDDFNYAREAISVRATDYILKPYEDEELLNAVDAGLLIHQKLISYYKMEKTEQTADRGRLEEDLKEDLKDKKTVIIEKISQFIGEHYQQDLSLQDAAGFMNYSEAYFCKLFKNCFQVNFTSYLTSVRIEEAKKLLRDPLINIKDVGEQVGYPDNNYFAKVFKRSVGMNPSEYRNTI